MGSVDTPFNPISLALGAEATFVARTLDSDRAHLTEVLRRPPRTAAPASSRSTRTARSSTTAPSTCSRTRTRPRPAGPAQHGETVTIGDREFVHDAHADNPAQAFEISRLDDGTMAHVPIGIFRQVERPTYDDQVRAQIATGARRARARAT